MLRTKSRDILQTIFALVVLPLLGIAQSSGVGRIESNAGLARGGAGSSALVEKVGTTFDKSVFGRLSKIGNRPKAANKTTTAKQKPGKGKPTILDNSNVVDDYSALVFRPAAKTATANELVSLLTSTAEEKEALLLIFSETKKAYEVEAIRFGHKNNVALALTFFIQTCVTIHNDAPEPSDLSTENLYQALAESLVESPEIAKMSNADKQAASDMLVYVSGFIIAGNMLAIETDDENLLETYRQIAGRFLQSLTGYSAESLEFDDNGLNIRN